jgi:hypothetical protein
MDNTLSLFDDVENEWQKEWKDMPEYSHKDLSPKFQIIVSFANYEDVKEFAKLMNMNVSPKTKTTWFPHRPHTKYTEGYGTTE